MSRITGIAWSLSISARPGSATSALTLSDAGPGPIDSAINPGAGRELVDCCAPYRRVMIMMVMWAIHP
jgi:hypothetical protein